MYAWNSGLDVLKCRTTSISVFSGKDFTFSKVAVLAVKAELYLAVSERGRHHCQVLQEEAVCIHEDAFPFGVRPAVHNFRDAEDGIGDAALQRAGDRGVFIRTEVDVLMKELHVLSDAF